MGEKDILGKRKGLRGEGWGEGYGARDEARQGKVRGDGRVRDGN